MLSNKDIFKEGKDAEDVRSKLESDYEKAMLKMAILHVKLLHNIRTNQVEIMKATQVPLKEPKKDGETTEQQS